MTDVCRRYKIHVSSGEYLFVFCCSCIFHVRRTRGTGKFRIKETTGGITNFRLIDRPAGRGHISPVTASCFVGGEYVVRNARDLGFGGNFAGENFSARAALLTILPRYCIGVLLTHEQTYYTLEMQLVEILPTQLVSACLGAPSIQNNATEVSRIITLRKGNYTVPPGEFQVPCSSEHQCSDSMLVCTVM